jgi:hypothetical protein
MSEIMNNINFDDLQVVEAEPVKMSLFPNNFILGCDPLDQQEESNYNVFYIFDKSVGRKTLLIKTKKTFDWFVNYITKNDIVKNFFVSTKFVNDAGRAKKYSEIGVRYNGLQSNPTT